MNLTTILWITVLLLIALAIMWMSIAIFPNAFAWDYFKTMQTQYNINPRVCMMLPDPNIEPRIEQLQNATTNALDEWQNKLNDKIDANWIIYREAYQWEDHNEKSTDDFKQCGAFVNYSGQVDSYMAQHGVLGTATVDINKGYFWIEIQTHIVKRSIQIFLGGSLNNSTSGVVSEPKLLPIIDIENVIKHEFGHALGLEHFYCNDKRSNCINDSIMYSKIDTFTNSTKPITERDINMIIKIYGKDGFGSPHHDIPKTCVVSKTKTC